MKIFSSFYIWSENLFLQLDMLFVVEMIKNKFSKKDWFRGKCTTEVHLPAKVNSVVVGLHTSGASRENSNQCSFPAIQLRNP